MLTIGNNEKEEILLTDEAFEVSEIVSMFLHMCQATPISPPKTSNEHFMRKLRSLIQLSAKYEAISVQHQLCSLVYQWHHEDYFPSYSVFTCAYLLDKPEMVAFAIRRGGNWIWNSDSLVSFALVDDSRNGQLIHRSASKNAEDKKKATDPVGTLNNLHDVYWMNPAAWRLETFKEVPNEYTFAMVRAVQYGKNDHTKVAEGFLKIMKEMGRLDQSGNAIRIHVSDSR
ncbi:uncharacterized protein L201_007285 [Kwoniella dendrophila CBS 6074]|uniref:BTB domain-containing protein n=1 Tax=Kwoniella dendrophila CBS 6074 TaxID=1295534 RepID=A0AAX4K401_9TREE